MNFKDTLKEIGRCFGFDLFFLALPIAIFVITTVYKIWWIPLLFLAVLCVLFLLKKYNIAKVLSSKYLSFWIDRIFFLCLTFTPVLIIYCLFSDYKVELKLIAEKWKFLLYLWPFSCSSFPIGWLLIVFFLIALTLYVIEEKLPESNSLRNCLQKLARFAPLITGIILLIIGFICFYELYKIEIRNLPEKQDAIITYTFYYNFFLVLPVLCHIPALLIVSKVTNQEKDKKYLFDYLFNFYKILYLEHSVAISFGIVILSISIGANFLHTSSNETSNKIEIWQLCLAIVRVSTPIILILTPFGEGIKNFEKFFESDFYRKLRNIISSMNEHKVILGYGYLGKDILSELKERKIVEDTEFLEIITPSLEKRKIHKNLLIVDKNAGVFNNSTSDPIYGSIGII